MLAMTAAETEAKGVCVFLFILYIYIGALQFLALCHLPSRWNISMTT